MLVSQADIEDFFTQQKIALMEERTISAEECAALYLRAQDLGYSFACFLHFGILNEDGNIATNFTSSEDLYDSYTCFMIGFSNTLNN